MEYTSHPSVLSQWRRVARLLVDAIRGKDHDFTQGSIRQAVVLLAVPMVLEMLMESIFAVVDIFFVSSLGADAVAVVGLTEATITLIYAVAIGIGMGVTATVARRIGEKNPLGAAETAGQALWIGMLCAIVIAGIGLFFAEDILRAMGASQTVIDAGRGYTTTMYAGSITILYLFLITAVFRGAGNASLAMQGLWLANGINIILDPCFIFGWWIFPELGVTGAAVATNIGRGAGVLFLLYHLFGKTSHVPMTLALLRWKTTIAVNLLRVSLGGIGQFFIATASWVFLMRIVSVYGSVAIAGYTIAIRVIMLTFLPAWGVSNAAATLVGQNLGANNPTRAEQSVWQTVKYNCIFMTLVAVILLVFAEIIIGFFSTDSAVISYGVYCLRVIALGYSFFAIGMVLTNAFNGAGDTRTPTWINFICFWLVQIPLAYGLANPLNWGPLGVYVAVAFSESLIAFIAFWQFRKGHWKLTKV